MSNLQNKYQTQVNSSDEKSYHLKNAYRTNKMPYEQRRDAGEKSLDNVLVEVECGLAGTHLDDSLGQHSSMAHSM